MNELPTFKDMKAIRMAIDNIAYEYRNKEDDEILYTLDEIIKEVETQEQITLFNRFRPVQAELLTLINKINKLMFTQNSILAFLKGEYFDPKTVIADDDGQIVAKQDYEVKDGKLTGEYRDGYFTFDDTHIEDLLNVLILNFKEIIISIRVIQSLGTVWELPNVLEVGNDFAGMSRFLRLNIESLKGLRIKFYDPVMTVDEMNKIENDLKDLSSNAPILQGYYNHFTNYEYKVGIGYERE